jgi:teichuronic acid biosynthesis glycosyltransferase TuaG
MSLVSVIIPTFNADEFIAATIQSVLTQSHTDLELFVVDDCSSDDTVKIVREISYSDSRLTLIELPENYGGPAGPRNIGVSKAVGKWICFLDADDLWHFSKLSRQLEIMEMTGMSFCATRYTRFNGEAGFDTFEFLSEQFKFEKYTFRQQCSRNRIANSSVMLAASLLRANPFYESHDYHAVEDMQCWLKILESGDDCVVLDAPLIGYRVSENQISRNKLMMAKKFFMVIKNYRLQSGASLGWRTYLFFANYCLSSLLALVKRKFTWKG